MNLIRRYVEHKLHTHAVLGRVPYGLRQKVWWRMAINRRHGFLYVRIPKAANSTVTKTLALHAWPESANWFAARDAVWAKRRFGHFGWRATPAMLLSEYYTFSFFRNPYSRILSAYLQKLQKPKYRWAATAAKVTRVDAEGFRSFVAWLEDGHIDTDIHWAPQTSICPLPVSKLHFLGRVEQLDADLSRLMHNLFPDRDYVEPATRQRDRQHAAGRLRDFYDDDLAERLHRLYRRDFEELGYPAALPGR